MEGFASRGEEWCLRVSEWKGYVFNVHVLFSFNAILTNTDNRNLHDPL